mmetsp:Transcript_10947/g.28722  ORF Transcript_10947/g.28722 Transcript_10947/m.28722 type:complete len:355 (-) Transcript_10947:824-1888(-)|eukprot:CAMPEP_0113891508 /NCGR_PEP_ID=MMETSP0780_2-20120614/14804_1 /TAXON_ID=652834 /ORGANISM="Palpitomonas bilix" /LENGTH=354 /DNA_ID=CAMNT_0000881151 /DNA_START=93 /DNA_END=1157 /DNA_ORIENTATION=+ /assembly_acc=CAM_ASM_000599
MSSGDGEVAFERMAVDGGTSVGHASMDAHEVKWSNLKKENFFFFGSSFFLGIRALVFPASLLKTRLQVARREGAYLNLRSAVKDIAKKEGFRGFYKGFGVSIVGAVPSQPLYAAVFELTRENVGKALRGRANPYVEKHYGWSFSETIVDGLSNAVGGMCATLSSQCIVVPADVVSQLSMVNQSSNVSGYRIAVDIVKNEGVPGLYRGFWPSLLTYAPSSAVWWFTYGAVKRNILHGFESRYGRVATDSEALAMQSFSGACAGFMSAVLLTPSDVIRTRAQVFNHAPAAVTADGGGTAVAAKYKPDSMLKVAKMLVKEEGAMGLTRGMLARVLNTVPVSALIILSYEAAKKLSTL